MLDWFLHQGFVYLYCHVKKNAIRMLRFYHVGLIFLDFVLCITSTKV